MPWTMEAPPAMAKAHPERERRACIAAANAVMEKQGTEAEAMQA